MATFADAVTERNRLMDAYVGVTARIAALSGAFGVAIHDVRPSELKTGLQSEFPHGWAIPLEPGTTQTAYP